MNTIRRFLLMLSGSWIDSAMDEVKDMVGDFSKKVHEMSVRAQLDGEDQWFLDEKNKDK